MNENDDHIEDRLLAQRILNGDVNAFGEIIKSTRALVGSIVFKMTANSADGADLIQDVYLKAFKNLKTFKFESRLSTWIARIAYNTCLNFIKKKTPGLPDTIDNSADNTVENANSTEAYLDEKELKTILTSEIEKLPLVYKTIINLYHQEQLSYNEIGTIMGLPEGTVKSYLFRARKLLKNNISAIYNYTP